MALDQNAGKRKAVGLARNLFPTITEEVSAANTDRAATTVSEAVAKSVSPQAAPNQKVYASTARSRNRIMKTSFMIDPALERRFRTARLKAGFEKLEDAYNEALTRFCDQVDEGKIDNF